MNHTFDAVTVTLNPAIDRTVTIPSFTAGVVNRVEDVRSSPGGKGVNVAAALANYGHRVAAAGFLGRENPAAFEALFAARNIADHFIRVAGRTRSGFKIFDPELHQTTDINFPGPTASPGDLAALSDQLADLPAPCFVLAGSLPPGVDVGIYRELTRMLKRRGCRVILDTSGAPLQRALEAQPDVVKPNLHELETLLGTTLQSEAAVVAAAGELIAEGIGLVVVSMGKEGACFVTCDEAVIARPPDVTVRSTVGAGDAMVAGVVSALARNLSLADCARLATAFSVHALTRTGDVAGALDSITSLLPQINLSNPTQSPERSDAKADAAMRPAGGGGASSLF